MKRDYAEKTLERRIKIAFLENHGWTIYDCDVRQPLLCVGRLALAVCQQNEFHPERTIFPIGLHL